MGGVSSSGFCVCNKDVGAAGEKIKPYCNSHGAGAGTVVQLTTYILHVYIYDVCFMFCIFTFYGKLKLSIYFPIQNRL